MRTNKCQVPRLPLFKRLLHHSSHPNHSLRGDRNRHHRAPLFLDNVATIISHPSLIFCPMSLFALENLAYELVGKKVELRRVGENQTSLVALQRGAARYALIGSGIDGLEKDTEEMF